MSCPQCLGPFTMPMAPAFFSSLAPPPVRTQAGAFQFEDSRGREDDDFRSPAPYRSNKDKFLAGCFALFFGCLGLHWFYLGQGGLGVSVLLSFFAIIGLTACVPPAGAIAFLVMAVMGLIRAIVLFTMDDRDFHRQYGRR